MIPDQNKRCKHCGAFLDENTQFCEDCGQPVAEPTVSQSQPSPLQVIPQPLVNPQYAPPPPLPQTNYSTEPAPKKNSNTCLTVGLGLLFGGLCLSVLAVGGYFIYNRFASPTQVAMPPATGQSPSSTPTEPPQPAGSTLLLDIDFAQPPASIKDKWIAEKTYIQSEFSGAEFHWRMQGDGSEYNHFVWLPDKNYADFTLESQARFVEGPQAWTYGLIFRFKDENNFYLFLVGYNGDYVIDKKVDGEWHRLQDWTISPALHASQANRLRVTCQGNQISVFANDILLTTVIDDSFDTGSVGLYIQGRTGIHVAYQYLKVWSAP